MTARDDDLRADLRTLADEFATSVVGEDFFRRPLVGLVPVAKLRAVLDAHEPDSAGETDEAPSIEDVLAAHQYRDVRGDYDAAPFYRHFGCTCGWKQNIAGMSGIDSWLAAHRAHVAQAIREAGAE